MALDAHPRRSGRHARHDTMNAVPTPKVTMIGGGQLARMTHQSAIALGQTLRVLAVTPDDPAAQVTPDVVIGSHTDLDALRRAAEGAQAFTFDHEHVPTELLEKLVAEGVNVAPPPEALIHAQDKLVMRRRLEAIGAPIPRYAEVTDPAELEAFAPRPTDRAQDRARRVRRSRRAVGPRPRRGPRLRGAQSRRGDPVLVEERVAMRRELAALVARSPFGQGAAWPVVETVQRDGICVEVIAPAQDLDARDRKRGRAAGAAAGRRTGRGRRAGGRAVRDRRRRAGRQRAGDATAQLRALDDGRRPHEPVRAAPARGAGLPARRHRSARAGHGDGQCAWRSGQTRRWAWTNGCTICSAGSPTRRCTSTARRSARAARSATSTSSAKTWRNCVNGPRRAAHWLSHAEWTDGWDGHG